MRTLIGKVGPKAESRFNALGRSYWRRKQCLDVLARPVGRLRSRERFHHRFAFRFQIVGYVQDFEGNPMTPERVGSGNSRGAGPQN